MRVDKGIVTSNKKEFIMNVTNQQSMNQLFSSAQNQFLTQSTTFQQTQNPALAPISNNPVSSGDSVNFSQSALLKSAESEQAKQASQGAVAGASKMVDRMSELAASASDTSLSAADREKAQKQFNSIYDSMKTSLSSSGNDALLQKIDKTISDGLKTADGEVVESTANSVTSALLKNESGNLSSEELQKTLAKELGSAKTENVQQYAENAVSTLTEKLGSQEKAIATLNNALGDYGVNLDKYGSQVASSPTEESQETPVQQSSENEKKTTFDLNSSNNAQAATNIMEDLQSVFKAAQTAPAQSNPTTTDNLAFDPNNLSMMNATQMQAQRMLNILA